MLDKVYVYLHFSSTQSIAKTQYKYHKGINVRTLMSCLCAKG